MGWGGVKGRHGSFVSSQSSFSLPEDYAERAGQESPDLRMLTALLFLHSTEVPTMVSNHLVRIPAPSWFKMFRHLSKWLIIFLILWPLLHTIYCNVNFSYLCTSLRSDSDLKAALVRPGPASIIRDVPSVSQKYSFTDRSCQIPLLSNEEWRKKEFFNVIIRTDTVPI